VRRWLTRGAHQGSHLVTEKGSPVHTAAHPIERKRTSGECSKGPLADFARCRNRDRKYNYQVVTALVTRKC
jgi:hypothetical protein